MTTVEPAVLAPGAPATASYGKAVRVSIGGDGMWYQNGSYGGVAYVGSFPSGSVRVCYVFAKPTSNLRWVADTVSHEAGHTLGLSHQSTYDAGGALVATYNSGTPGVWIPIMGTNSSAAPLSTWHNGTSHSATTFQDDLAVIAGTTNGFGYRADDHGNTAAAATPLAAGGATWTGAGVVGTNTDVDYFSFTIGTAGVYRVTAAGPGSDANLDAVVELRTAAGSLLQAADPDTSLNASAVRRLTPGTYTVAVRSNGTYGRIGSYAVTVDTPPAGVTVAPATPLLTTREDGGSASFTVVLDTPPLADVVVPVYSTAPGEGVPSVSSLTFTPANWNVPQTVVVSGVADGVADGDAAYAVVVGAAVSGDADYAGRDPADVALANVDADPTGFLYRVDNATDTIERARLDGTRGETLIDLAATFGAGTYSPYGIAVDEAGGRVYWVDNSMDAVYRANLDGSAAERVLTLPAGAAWSLVIDAAAGKMFWPDAANKTIQRANLDGTGVETVVTPVGAPYGLALDAAAGVLYWTEVTANVSTIRRVAVAGGAAETLWTSTGASAATTLALDVAAGKMYWSDSVQKLIRRADLTGLNVEVVVDAAPLVPNAASSLRGLAVDPAGGKLYWADWGSKTVYRANLDGTTAVALGSAQSSFGLAVVRPTAGVSVTGRTGLVTTEGGPAVSFRVVLTTAPTSTVVIPVSSGDTTEGTVSVTSLTFTPANWSVPQTVTVTPVDDAATDGNVTYAIVLGTTSSSDAAYGGLNPADATVTNNDNDFTKFFVADDGAADRTYRYGASANDRGNSALTAKNTAPRGVATTAAGDKVWVIDANKTVYVYSAAGALLGSWSAGSLPKTAVVEGITVWGADVWVVDAAGRRVYRYANAAGKLSGSVNAAGSFLLAAANTGAKDLVTDGTHVWVVDNQVLDKVYKYTLAGTLVGSWAIDPANGSPTGITLDPANPRHLWIVDNGTDRVYQYDNAVTRAAGSQGASASYALAAGNTNPQGIADPPPQNGEGATAAGTPAGDRPDPAVRLAPAPETADTAAPDAPARLAPAQHLPPLAASPAADVTVRGERLAAVRPRSDQVGIPARTTNASDDAEGLPVTWGIPVGAAPGRPEDVLAAW